MKFVCLRYPKLQMTFKTEIKREVAGEILREPSKIIQFTDGYYSTIDPKEIAFIKRHSDYGGAIHQVENEPGAVVSEKG